MTPPHFRPRAVNRIFFLFLVLYRDLALISELWRLNQMCCLATVCRICDRVFLRSCGSGFGVSLLVNVVDLKWSFFAQVQRAMNWLGCLPPPPSFISHFLLGAVAENFWFEFLLCLCFVATPSTALSSSCLSYHGGPRQLPSFNKKDPFERMARLLLFCFLWLKAALTTKPYFTSSVTNATIKRSYSM